MTVNYYKGFRILLFIMVAALVSINITLAQTVVRQGPPVPLNFCISANEKELYNLINEYRKQNKLPPIPLSKSLSYVAALHAKDLYLNHPDQGACNFHSWSNKGSWTPFCYPRDENKKNSVWDKPRSLTKYPSKAYEIVYWENNPLVKDTVIMVWKMEDYYNSFLLNTGKWLGKPWKSIGIAIYENYACAWFGEVADPEGLAIVCGSKPAKEMIDTLPGKKPDTVTAGKEVLVSKTDSTSGIYYIIVKSNLTREASDKLVATFRVGVYPGAKVLEKDGKLRISVYESPDRATVQAKLKEVKKTYKDAWLLKR